MNTILLPQKDTTLLKLLRDCNSAINIALFIIAGFDAHKKDMKPI
jgi:hypothetical protein